MIEYKTGNLFTSEANAYVHGCNIKGKMNAGIAVQFRERFPEMFEDYQQRCRKGLFLPGEGYIYYNRNKPHVINLATQDKNNAGIVYMESAFKWLANSFNSLGIENVAMPRIGSGLGELDWDLTREILERYFNDSELKVEVWSR